MRIPLDLLPEVDWSVAIVDLGSGGRLVEHDPARLLSAASLGKVFVLVELAERLRAGDLDEATLLDRRAVAPVTDSGLWQHLATDTLPVADVATLVGAVSDNLATNVLLDLLGLDAVRVRAADWAPGGSNLVDIVRGLRGPGDPPHLSLASADDLVHVLARLWAERDHPGSVGARVLRWLATGTDLSMVASAFHQDPLSHAEDPTGTTLVTKTGTNLGVRGDIGVVERGGHATAYAVLANWTEDPPGRRRDDVMRALRGVGERLRAHVEEPR